MHAITSGISLAGFMLASGAQALSTSGFMDARMYDSMGGMATCITGIVPLEDVTSPNNYMINAQIPKNQIEVTQNLLSLQSTKIGAMLEQKIVGKQHSVTASANISATLCHPKQDADSSKAIQVLTHGIGFDHTYWDFTPELSYVDVAAKYGASTFLYDRFGVGQSSQPGGDHPIQTIQGQFHVALLNEMIKMLKAGHFCDMKFAKVVSTGHSFGSAITAGLTSLHPGAVDAAILTGFTVNATAVPFFTAALDLQLANMNSPLRFGSLTNGYLVGQNVISTQWDFFHYPGFKPENLYLAELGKQTVTMGELLTLPNVGQPSPKFTGPVYVANGMYDVPYCYGNCASPSDQGAAVPKMLYPNSKTTDTKLYPNSGHGLNLHTIAPVASNDIQKFLKQSGL